VRRDAFLGDAVHLRVRICTSNGKPRSLITEVCSDW
jgi:hypothetical protein